MKKVLLMTVCLLFSFGASAALRNGPYLAGRVGADYIQYRFEDEKENDTRFMWDMALGVRLKNIRGEFEWANTPNSRLKEEGFDFEAEQQRYMLQLYYDFPIRSALRPFVNVGAGASYIEVTTDDNGSSNSDDDTTFTWNVGAGLGLNVTRHLSFDLGYRYIDAGKQKFFKDADSVKIRNHEGYFGIRYTF